MMREPEKEKKTVRVSVAIVEQDDLFLVGIREAKIDLAGYAEFPGGKCQPNEDSHLCAERECFEETGIAVAASTLLEKKTHEYDHAIVNLSFWLCVPEKGQAFQEEQSEKQMGTFHWVSRRDLIQYRFPEANQSIIQKLLKG